MESHLSASAAGPVGINLASWHFLLIAALAIVGCRLIKPGRARMILLALVNGYFLSFFILGLYPAIVLGGLLAVTFAVGELKVRYGAGRLAAAFTLVVVSLWCLLFLIKDSTLLGPANPFYYRPVRLIGISYLVFRCIQYVMDADSLDGRNWLTFLNFTLFFPTLLAGPIERYDRFQEDLERPHELDASGMLRACHRIANGMIKKFVLADNLMVFGIFMNPARDDVSTPLVWLGLLSQLALLYLDFSGYCDIVIGVARLMGFELTENFDAPFMARNIQQFWNRWHISLTHFLRDYVFMPINHLIVYHASRRWQFPLVTACYFFTMLLIALWHGTTWGFVAFGVAHGTALVLIQILNTYVYPRLGKARLKAWDDSAALAWLARGANYVFVCLTMPLWFYGVGGALAVYRALLPI